MHTPFRWLALLLAVGSFSAARASHVRGGDISFASVASTTAGVPRYHVVVRRFEGVSSPITTTSVLLNVVSALAACSSGGTGQNITVPRTTAVDGPTLLCTATASTPFYRAILFETDLDLPTGQWRLSTSESARISDIQNITNSSSTSMYIEAFLDNTLTAQDASPQFESVLQPQLNPTALAQHSFSAFDTDGDSLRYESMLALNSCGQAVPGTLATQFHLNFASGAFEPMVSTSNQGYYSTVVRVSEYRKMSGNRWVLLGSVMRDQTYLVASTTNQPPTFTTMQVNGGAAQALGPAIAARPGQAVSVLLQATDPDAGQTLRFASEAPKVVPGLTLTRVGTTNSELLTWQVPATLPPGRYRIAVGVLDDGCTINTSEERTLTFVVGSAALATRAAATATDVFPVPFREQVQFTTAPNQAVVLVDALGREVARLTSSATGLVRWQPTPALPPGLYLARAATSGLPLARLLRAE